MTFSLLTFYSPLVGAHYARAIQETNGCPPTPYSTAMDPSNRTRRRELTRERQLLLIFDEVQTGMGRTGSLFAYQQLGVEPDIMTLGKGIGGGVPQAALLSTETVSCFAPGDQGGTFNRNALVCAAGLTVMDVLLAPGFLSDVRRKGDYLAERLREPAAYFDLGDVRGRGLLQALNTGRRPAKTIVGRALSKGLLPNAPRPGTLRFMPALTVTEAEIDRMIVILTEILEEIEVQTEEAKSMVSLLLPSWRF